MSTQIQQAKSTSTNSSSRIDQYIGKQIRQTSTQVRYSDIATGILTLVSFTIAFFLAAAVVDAWLWPLSHFARLLALMTWLIGLGCITWFFVVPHFLRRINPEYAAKVIEESRSGFKNSLLNYFALRRGGSTTHRAIMNEVSRRAATDLSHVAIDSAVDKSNVIRIGFVLVALLAAAIGYIILSPKNPLPTIYRVLAPASRVAQPSAVVIAEVDPGDTQVFFGEKLEVIARIVGKHDPADVKLVYSTLDSQTVNAVRPMQYSGSNGTYAAILETGPAGIQQPLHYHVEALDGRSPQYRVDVRPNPSITVNSIQITPPTYTQLPKRTLQGTGEIQAVEGSVVDITATANLPIEVAYIVPLIANEQDAGEPNYRELRSITMKSDGNLATGGFTAVLNSNRDRPLFTHYKIKFNSRDGFQNTQPNIYPVRVVADLAPEVEIVQPKQKEIAVPVNQPFVVEAWAADLDYQISSLDLQIDHQGTRILDRNLHINTEGQDLADRVQGKITITPKELSLKSGDRAILFATAADNRISPSSKLPDPNISRTENYTIIITDPIDEPEKVADDTNNQQKRDDQKTDSQQQQQQPHGQPNEPKQDDGDSPDENGQENQPTDDDSSTQADEQNDAESNPTQAASNQSESPPSDQQPGSGKNGEQQDSGESDGDPSQNQNSNANQPSEDSNSEQQQPGQNNRNSRPSSPDQTTGDQRQAGGEGEQQATDDMQSSDGRTDQQGGQARQPDQQINNNGNQRGNAQDENGGGDSDGIRDENLQRGESQPLGENASQGEQFEKLKEYFDRQQTEQNDSSPAAANQDREQQSADASQDRSDSTGNQNDSNPGQSDSTQHDGQADDPNQQNNSPNSSADNRSTQPSNPTANQQPSDPRDGDPSNNSSNNSEQQNSQQSQQSPDQNAQPQSQPASASDSQNQSQQPQQSQQTDSASQSGQPQDANSQQQSSAQDGSSQASTGSQNQQSQNQQSQNDTDSQSPSQSDSGGQPGQQGDSSQQSSSQSDASDSEPPNSQQSGQPGSESSTSQPSSRGQDSQNSGGSDQPGDGSQPPNSGSQGESQTQDQSQSQQQGQSQAPGQSPGQGEQSDSGQGNAGEPASQSSHSQDGNSSAMPPQDASSSAAGESSDSNRQGPRTGGQGGAGGSSEPIVPDKANLDHAKQVTDLVINKLDEQKFDPDQDLLDQMNWTQQDLENFLRQWQKMKENADSGSIEAKQTYEDALRSLGLQRDVQRRNANVKRDKPFQLNEDGAVDQIPSEYVDQFKAYLKRRSRSRRQ